MTWSLIHRPLDRRGGAYEFFRTLQQEFDVELYSPGDSEFLDLPVNNYNSLPFGEFLTRLSYRKLKPPSDKVITTTPVSLGAGVRAERHIHWLTVGIEHLSQPADRIYYELRKRVEQMWEPDEVYANSEYTA